MLAGEGYCFTQVRSAVSFIETLNHEYLKMNELDFEKYIFLYITCIMIVEIDIFMKKNKNMIYFT